MLALDGNAPWRLPYTVQVRSKHLDRAAGSGATFIESGCRRTLKGNRVKIKDVRLFNVSEPSGGTRHH